MFAPRRLAVPCRRRQRFPERRRLLTPLGILQDGAERCPRSLFAERGCFARQQVLSTEHPCTCVILTRLVLEFAVAVDFLI